METAPRPKPDTPSLPKPQTVWLETLRRSVTNHLDDSAYTVAQFARDVGLSARTLNRKLRTTAQVNANGFIRNERLRVAAELLRRGLSVAEVAYRVGFENPAYFAHCFKKRFGNVPSRYAAAAPTGLASAGTPET